MSSVPASVPVVVTGASSGIGEEFARRFAARGHAVTLVARRRDRLEAVAAALRADHGVVAEVMVADLSRWEERRALGARLASTAHILVNNAGFGTRGAFVTLDPAREAEEVNLNVVAVHELTAAALPRCVEEATGGVINVASTAAYQPLPFMSTYGATKAFVLHFTEGLAAELAGTGVRMTALCPGPTRTEFGAVSGVGNDFDLLFPMKASTVVSSALRAFDRRHAICVPGPLNQAGALGVRLVPRALLRRAIAPVLARG